LQFQKETVGRKLWAGQAMVGLATLSPIFMLGLFYGQASGMFTNTAALRDAKYGNDPAYRIYADNTPLILPLVAAPPKEW
jgi:hypothetical protein